MTFLVKKMLTKPKLEHNDEQVHRVIGMYHDFQDKSQF